MKSYFCVFSSLHRLLNTSTGRFIISAAVETEIVPLVTVRTDPETDSHSNLLIMRFCKNGSVLAGDQPGAIIYASFDNRIARIKVRLSLQRADS